MFRFIQFFQTSESHILFKYADIRNSNDTNKEPWAKPAQFLSVQNCKEHYQKYSETNKLIISDHFLSVQNSFLFLKLKGFQIFQGIHSLLSL